MSTTQHDSSSPFDYGLRLTGEKIRLLKFVDRTRGQSRDGNVLSLELISGYLPTEDGVTASDHVPYLALSYVWGDPSDPKTILVNGVPFKVTQNLERALMDLEPNIKLPIWIDAVCINQNDEDEKGQQVARMRDIYQNAEQTIVWLGERGDFTDLVMAQLDRIGRDALDAGILKLDEKDFKKWPNLEHKQEIKTALERLLPRVARGYEDRTPFPLAAFVELSNRPWFSRVWVIQELVVAKNYMFTCGGLVIPGDHFIAGFMFCLLWIANALTPLKNGSSVFALPFRLFSIWWRNGTPLFSLLLQGLQNKPIMPSPRAAKTLGTRRRYLQGLGTSLKAHLVRAFTGTSDFSLGATEPKDRVYAMLGIAADAKTLGIRPDYKKETRYQFVYSEVAKKLIHQGHIDILVLCRLEDSRDAGLPTWAPDWTQKLPTPWGGFREDLLSRAAGDTVYTPGLTDKFGLSPTVLCFEAFFVGTICETGSAWKPSFSTDFDYHGASRLLHETANFLSRDGTRYCADEIEQARWRIPIGDKELNPIGTAQRATNKSSTEYLEMKALIDTVISNRFKGLPKLPKATSYLTTMKDMYNARPFLSRNGYTGLCADVSRQGDEIYIPLGSHVPFILRRADQGFHKLVGEAYVHGVMYGELSDTSPAKHVVRLI